MGEGSRSIRLNPALEVVPDSTPLHPLSATFPELRSNRIWLRMRAGPNQRIPRPRRAELSPVRPTRAAHGGAARLLQAATDGVHSRSMRLHWPPRGSAAGNEELNELKN